MKRPSNEKMLELLAADLPEGNVVRSVGLTGRFRVVERAEKGPWVVQHLEIQRALGPRGGHDMGYSWKSLLICNVDVFEGIEAMHAEQSNWAARLNQRRGIGR